MRKNRRYDVLIVGGGPAGSTIGVALARRGVSVALFDAKRPCRRAIETAPPHLNVLLERIGASRDFHRQGHALAEGIVSIWGTSIPFCRDFIYEPHCNGWHVDRALFDLMLINRASAFGCDVFRNSRVVEFRNDRREWSCNYVHRGQLFSCSGRFAVDATGRIGGAALAHLSPRVVTDAMIGVSWSARSITNDPYALVESVDDGWFFSAVLPDLSASVVYSTDADIYRAQSKTPDFALRQLKKASYTRARIADMDYSNPRIHAAATIFRPRVTGDRWLAAGDAALSLDSLSGQGLCAALDMAHRAATTIHDYLNGIEMLNEYSAWIRKRMNADIQASQHYYSKERRWPASQFWRRRILANRAQNA